MTFLRRHWLILFICLTALCLRLYRLPATQTFLEDEGRDLLISYRMIDTWRPVLLGPQTSTGNMYLGPLYYYLTTPSLLLSGLNPLGPSIFIALTGVLTTYLLFVIGRQIFSPGTGILAATLYAVMPLAVVFTRNSWNPNLAPVFSLLMFYLTYRVLYLPKVSLSEYFWLGIAAGALVQMHYLALLYLVGTALVILVSRFRTPLLLFRSLLLSLAGFTLILSPFIIFEFRNDFVNTKAITRFVEAREEHNIRYSLPLDLWGKKVNQVSSRLFASAFGRDALTVDPARSAITLIVIAAFIVGLFRSRHYPDGVKSAFRLLFWLILIPLLLTGIYQENIHLHYLGFFFPLLYLLAGATIHAESKTFKPLLILYVLLAIYALPQLFSYLGSNPTNQVIRAREVAAYIQQKANGRPYNVVSASGTPTTPYQYFLAISPSRPTNAPASTVFMVCQGQECSNSDLNSPFIFITGQAHPTISSYLGHPLSNYYEAPRIVISNEHVSHGAWVAEMMVE